MQPNFTKLFWLLSALAVSPLMSQAGGRISSTINISINQSTITGRVVDANGNPIAGASITNLTGKSSAQTDAYGNFKITANEGDQIQATFVGFQTQIITAKSSSNLFTMIGEANAIEEIEISIGYQKIRKSDLTGAIASVKADELNITSPKLSQALVGKVAGVQISQTSGAPYDGTKIRVRGMGSVNAGSDPLYVIDGYPAGNNLNINPNDIESIDVLKDAASAAIYGSRAAGGVVLITTKRGKQGKNNIDYEVLAGFGQLSKKIDLLNAEQFIDLLIDGRNNSYKDLILGKGQTWTDAMRFHNNATRVSNVGNAGSVTIPEDYYDFATGTAKQAQYDTDWQDELYRNAPFQRHNLSISGGNEKNRYFVSGSYQDQQGIMLNTGQKVFNFRSNIDSKVTDWLTSGANVSFT